MKMSMEKLKKYTIISSFLFLIVYFTLPAILIIPSPFGKGFSSDAAAVGDTFGGILGPIVGFGAIVATFWAFYLQVITNEEQKKQFEAQHVDLKIERFENRFFELIKIHRENVEGISISSKGIVSRKAFISMFNEFRSCFHIIYKMKKEDYNYLKMDDKDLINIAFVLFYIGIGKNSNPLSMKLLSKYDEEFINNSISELTRTRKEWYIKEKDLYKIKIPAIDDKLPELDAYLSYRPFDGHMSRLGHYLRHIWLTVKYLDKQNDNIFKNKDKDKYEYIKIFRAQISSYEQLLLHYNSLTDLGHAWIEEGLIKKYKLTKNIPVPMAYFGPDPIELYEDENYFEWNEIS